MMRKLKRAVRWLARTYWPLVPTFGTVYGVWLMFGHMEFGEHDRKDGWLLFWVGCGYAVISAVVLVRTRHWTWRDLGQLLTYSADAMLYVVFGAAILGWRENFRLDETNLLRALFAVGMPVLLIGLAWWSGDTRFGTRDEGWALRRYKQWRCRNKPAPPDPDPHPDQRIAQRMAVPPRADA